MSTNPEEALPALLARARNSLWGWRSRRTMRWGTSTSAMAVLVAGLSHLLVGAVPVGTWLALAVTGPIVAACYALVRQRPDQATAAAALDKHGDYREFFLSAWEAYAMPAPGRSAGAQALVQRAAVVAPSVSVPVDWSESTCWYSRIALLPWVALLVGLFLLQLPGAKEQLPVALPVDILATEELVNAGRTGGWERHGGAPASGGRQETGAAPQPGLPREQKPLAERPEQVVPLGEMLTAELLQQEDTGAVPLPGGPGGVLPTESGTNPNGAGAGSAANASGRGVGPGQPLPPAGQAVKYLGIARTGNADLIAAGRDSTELARHGRRSHKGDIRLPTRVLARPANRHYVRQFSPSQRLQISAYFQNIEDLQ